ncbi:MAG: hypothetical protein H7A46_21485 [Verrucomicrobiales bacterium]|nr:hypothetical protein [Verrucomicrobiales bacterium]
MKDNAPTPPSAWPFTVAAVILALVTVYLLGLYSTVHWELRHASDLIGIRAAELHADSLTDTNFVELSAERMQALQQAVDELNLVSGTVMERLGAYQLTGLGAFLCSIVALRRRPKLAGVVGLAFGLLGLGLAAVIM